MTEICRKLLNDSLCISSICYLIFIARVYKESVFILNERLYMCDRHNNPLQNTSGFKIVVTIRQLDQSILI